MTYSFLLLLGSCLCTGLVAQSFQITNLKTGNTVAANEVSSCATAAHAQADLSYSVKNLTAQTQTLSVRKYEDQLNQVAAGDQAQAFFCTGAVCYVPAVMSATFALAAADSMELKLSLQEASVAGSSTLRYKVSNAAASESVQWTIQYMQATSIAAAGALAHEVSEVYPNPSSAACFISLKPSAHTQGMQLRIYDSAGALVSVRTIGGAEAGETTLRLSDGDLPPGLYLLLAEAGSRSITRKFIITP